MELIKVKNYEDMSQQASQMIVDKINRQSSSVIGLATGSTPERLYELLIEAYNRKGVSFTNTAFFNLDEYVGLSKSNTNSYHYYMKTKLFDRIDVSPEQTNIPNGTARDLQKECLRYEARLEESGGIDIQLLGLGRNGHIGFNEPNTPFSMRTHVVDLDASTRKANARFFQKESDVPTKAITMGIKTILSSKQILLMVSGEKKAAPLRRLLYGEVSEDFPASVLHQHPNVTIIADEVALSTIDYSDRKESSQVY